MENAQTVKPLASEGNHWYGKHGNPVYEVPRAKGDGMRPTNLSDARKISLVPSVTTILKVLAQPGLEIWKAQQILESALTLPKLPGEMLDDYASRVVEDSKVQSKKARDRGHELHAAVEQYIHDGSNFNDYTEHVVNTGMTLAQFGIDLTKGNAEHSFASPLGYGGKIDFHNDEPLVIDFKTKDKIDDKKQLVWPEHVQQLAAYGFGLFSLNQLIGGGAPFRAINVFIGVTDKQVRVFEHEWSDIVEGFEQFKLLLTYWQRSKKFGPYAKGK